MKQNLSVLKKSRPLIIAAVGIAFFSLMTLYLRQSLLFQGETVEEIVLPAGCQNRPRPKPPPKRSPKSSTKAGRMSERR